ncbi:MarR family winged helix-turn-helix transcriptional regulator [Clostridium aciditolerans]|uniref:MarR family transcriptional regulator n=1 Tax=Clostridium aciditolerans TaxID=339861 RepID=A0A934HY69_9CLOT|nr:MarR family transcriptional regulator [Clostridium aciditolerans]MBI6874204.1 MarR family transcriptional regulator [Clostridium aciditolerans]
MCKESIHLLSEKLLAVGPIIIKKIARLGLPSSGIISINQLMVLGILQEEGSLSISEICRKLTISKPQMTIILDKLAKNGLVYRIYNDKDRRTININITENGNEYCKNLSEVLKENLSRKLIALSEEDLTTLLNSLEITECILKRLE